MGTWDVKDGHIVYKLHMPDGTEMMQRFNVERVSSSEFIQRLAGRGRATGRDIHPRSRRAGFVHLQARVDDDLRTNAMSSAEERANRLEARSTRRPLTDNKHRTTMTQTPTCGAARSEFGSFAFVVYWILAP